MSTSSEKRAGADYLAALANGDAAAAGRAGQRLASAAHDRLRAEARDALRITDRAAGRPPEPHCNHDAAAVRDGVCECGERITVAGDETIAVSPALTGCCQAVVLTADIGLVCGRCMQFVHALVTRTTISGSKWYSASGITDWYASPEAARQAIETIETVFGGAL
jgi:hypothetical protein